MTVLCAATAAAAEAMPKRIEFAPLPIVEPLEAEETPWTRAQHLLASARSALPQLANPRKLLKSLGEQSEVALAALAWAACSIGMTVLNKLAVNRTRAPVAVVVLQMLATCAVAAASGNLHFGQGWKLWAVSVPPLFVLMMVTSMLALQHVTVGTFVVLRNLGPIVTLGIETVLHRPDNLSCDLHTTASLAAIAAGVALYESHEVRLSLTGFFYLLANLAFACAERMLQRHLLAVKSVDVSKPALMILNNGIGAVLAGVVMLVLAPREGRLLVHSLHHKARARHALHPPSPPPPVACTACLASPPHTPTPRPPPRLLTARPPNAWQSGTGLAVVLSCVIGCAISYSGLWLQRLVTATSFMVLGSITKLVVIVFGIVFFADAAGPISVFGAGLSVFGGYSYARLK